MCSISTSGQCCLRYFGDQAAEAVVRRFLTAEQTSAGQEFARGVFDVARTHQSEELALVQWPVSRRGGKQAVSPGGSACSTSRNQHLQAWWMSERD
jgi:hypothetical protein